MSSRGKSTALGAAIGAVGGAVLTGGSAIGTVGGAAVGSVVGNQINKSNPHAFSECKHAATAWQF
jgi:osmotically inducible lipoprotein OsmB